MCWLQARQQVSSLRASNWHLQRQLHVHGLVSAARATEHLSTGGSPCSSTRQLFDSQQHSESLGAAVQQPMRSPSSTGSEAPENADVMLALYESREASLAGQSQPGRSARLHGAEESWQRLYEEAVDKVRLNSGRVLQCKVVVPSSLSSMLCGSRSPSMH